MTVIHYLAYGSNLHPHRLKVRIPSSRFIGVAALSGYQLTFHKRGACGSGKCNLIATPDTDSEAYVAIFEMHRNEQPILDEIEGEGYAVEHLDVNVNGQSLSCFAYLAQPTHIDDRLRPYNWYQEIVYRGAAYHGFPKPYLNAIASVSAVADPDRARNRLHQQLIQQFDQHIREPSGL